MARPTRLAPLSQRSRLAAAIADNAGRLLPYPFTPYPSPERRAALLSVAVLRQRAVAHTLPTLAVSRGDLPQEGGGESGSSSAPKGSGDHSLSSIRLLKCREMTRLGLEPRTLALKVRCSAN